MNASLDSAASHRSWAFATQVLPSILYSGAIFYGGLIRLAELPPVGFMATDKLLHLFAFGGLAILLARSGHFFRPLASVYVKLICGALGASFLGLLLELCQATVSYRSADAWDWVADTVGALLAVASASLLLRCLPRPSDG